LCVGPYAEFSVDDPHRELIGIRLPEQRQVGGLAMRRHRRVEDGHVALEDLRAGSRRHALRRDHVLDRERDATAVGLVLHVQVGVQLAVARVDRSAVGVEQLSAAHLLAREQAHRAPRRSTGACRCSCGRHPEVVVITVRRVGEDLVAGQRRAKLILAPRVRDLQRVRGRRHVGKIELRHLRDRLEDRRELLLEAPDLVVGQFEAREPRDAAALPLSRSLPSNRVLP